MTKEEVRFQVAISCIQGVLEAKHGILGEVIPYLAVHESLRIADEFVKQWFEESDCKQHAFEEVCEFIKESKDIDEEKKKKWINLLKDEQNGK